MARLFKRLQDLFAANLDELLDRGLPQEQLFREVNAGIHNTQEALHDAQNSQRQLIQILHQHRQQAQRWRRRATQALHQDDEALARESLICQRDTETLIALLEQAQHVAQQTCQRLQAQHRTLEQQLAKAHRHAGNTPNHDTQGGAYEFLGRMGARLADMSANLGRTPADTQHQLAQNFRDIEQDAQLESELAALRREVDEK